MSESRHNPDQLLKEIQADEENSNEGHLKIFFGYAAGVGKTYAMLEAAHMEKQQGIDVVAGYVETHARPKTAALLNGLEVLPTREVFYNGMILDEFDIGMALKRKPQLILVDELAHTNAEGCRHAKRYQDIKELLNAGIDVYTTVNVQHIESLCDTVASITEIVVRERIPDSIFDNADQVELIDIEPQDLINRLNTGNVYRQTQEKQAVENFFTIENLTALREISLRRCADRVNILTENTRIKNHGDYHTGEHILVCLSSSPSNAKIIRTAAKMASAFKGEFTALFVETPDFSVMSEENVKRLRSNICLAEQLGAKIETVYGEDVPFQIAEFTRLSGVSKIVIGRSSATKRHLLSKPTLTEKLIDYAPNLDVHIIPDTVSNAAVYQLRGLQLQLQRFGLHDGLRHVRLHEEEPRPQDPGDPPHADPLDRLLLRPGLQRPQIRLLQDPPDRLHGPLHDLFALCRQRLRRPLVGPFDVDELLAVAEPRNEGPLETRHLGREEDQADRRTAHQRFVQLSGRLDGTFEHPGLVPYDAVQQFRHQPLADARPLPRLARGQALQQALLPGPRRLDGLVVRLYVQIAQRPERNGHQRHHVDTSGVPEPVLRPLRADGPRAAKTVHGAKLLRLLAAVELRIQLRGQLLDLVHQQRHDGLPEERHPNHRLQRFAERHPQDGHHLPGRLRHQGQQTDHLVGLDHARPPLLADVLFVDSVRLPPFVEFQHRRQGRIALRPEIRQIAVDVRQYVLTTTHDPLAQRSPPGALFLLPRLRPAVPHPVRPYHIRTDRLSQKATSIDHMEFCEKISHRHNISLVYFFLILPSTF